MGYARQHHPRFAHIAFGGTLAQIRLQSGGDFSLIPTDGVVQPPQLFHPEGVGQGVPLPEPSLLGRKDAAGVFFGHFPRPFFGFRVLRM